MRWISRVLGAVLLVAVAAQPAEAVVITTHWGNSDAPQYATPAAFIDVFFNHSNGKRYRCNTGPYGVCQVDIPDGTITSCQAYNEDNLVASYPCGIPVGEQALAEATAGAKTQTAGEAPQNADDPGVVVTGSRKGGQQRVVYDVARGIYEREGGLLYAADTNADEFRISLFFPEWAAENASAGDGDGDGGNGD